MRLAFPLLSLLAVHTLAHAATPEEDRLGRAAKAMPATVQEFAGMASNFAQDWSKCANAAETQKLAADYGSSLWFGAKANLRKQQDPDDRALYWGRLAIARTVRDEAAGFAVSPAERAAALAALEKASRGMDDVNFSTSRETKRILLTGFDPFGLERRLDQSNPSGVAALMLDGEQFEVGGQRVRIETAIFPVRFADFDAGMLENWLRPWMNGRNVDMVVTVSMGRSDFDLERFPGRRRSDNWSDNLNASSGGNYENPVPGQLNGQPINGAEFVEFSLPAAAMLQVQSPFAVHDNRWVRFAPNTRFSADSLAALNGKTAVEGSGGGYLSNEISYRAVRLRDELGLGSLPVGHIHTPAISSYDPNKLRAITAQIRAMLVAAWKNGN
ncbi:hypothetical protein FNU76_18080 [Chitinimonas arctica]|uniref:Pyroglutamyl peptidase n=1 Tax=Chitinimonas arctica TaxID=2594795 RepID=A0A516SIX3_9NEIS|nr:hypothetical protein [Chitinimonas arctica]QDQ28100.1 hypothetical protein FNU76_18080 [Chitinimonas arctica]